MKLIRGVKEVQIRNGKWVQGKEGKRGGGSSPGGMEEVFGREKVYRSWWGPRKKRTKG